MQTVLNIDQGLFEAALKTSVHDDINKIVEAALREFIDNHGLKDTLSKPENPSALQGIETISDSHKQTKVLSLFATGGISEDYNYKALRSGGQGDVSG